MQRGVSYRPHFAHINSVVGLALSAGSAVGGLLPYERATLLAAAAYLVGAVLAATALPSLARTQPASMVDASKEAEEMPKMTKVGAVAVAAHRRALVVCVCMRLLFGLAAVRPGLATLHACTCRFRQPSPPSRGLT